MINQSNFIKVLEKLDFENDNYIFKKNFNNIDAYLEVDFSKEKFIYPEDKLFKINESQCNFSSNENFVVFECVSRLFEKGYKPNHIELEPRWQVGHGASGGRADIMVKDNLGKPFLIIECKTPDKEFDNAWKDTLNGKGQLFTYAHQERNVQFICLYTSDFVDGNVRYLNHIILVQDKNEILELKKNENPISYNKATTSSELFQAWRRTYENDFYTKGIFETDIQPYQIGKTKYTVNDLQIITSSDIQPKYHEFATILRQHNISGRENAFDKLINLFLCKIVDEKSNPNDLQFYWRGIAYDNYFDIIDRLQRLYRDGMAAFLKEEVTYIDNQTISDAFKFVKSDPDATRDKVLNYFRQQKYFTNNDFSFLDVHNEKLFYQNTNVLLKIVRMLQDIKLNGNQQNQFLGDLFEGFLDQGIKQTEGQFFTPLPITRFIISSLPLENILKNDEPPYIIDYACGAGHFLTEIASQIRKEKNKVNKEKLKNYYKNIYGIEKEYRLSKVAKVSSFMYNQDEINIIYADALAQHKDIKNNYFDILVSNPPYSVKGFLETLSETDKRQFELVENIDFKSYPSNNSIETFFIERAKQLLKPGGIAEIIIPSSILSKGKSKNVYTVTREILLKYFNIIAIVDFGSGTFSKTGTNTVTLFLRKKTENPIPAIHYLNRIKSWFDDNNDKKDKKSKVFQDGNYINYYCNHIGISYDDYKTLLEGKPNEVLLQIDIFQDYKREFENLSEIKNLKKQRNFKTLTEEEQETQLQRRFIDYIKEIEKEKLYYFILAFQNPQPVLIVKSHLKTNEIKEFLGYEWSAAKGNEGIKYLTSGASNITQINNEDNEVESEDIVQNLRDLDSILTPLYDPQNKLNPEKINTLITKNFNGEDFEIPESLQKYVSKANLIDMIDFNLAEFNKAIGLAPKKNISFETKGVLVRLGDIVNIKIGGTPSRGNNNYFKGNNLWVSVSELNNNIITDTKEKITDEAVGNSNVKLIPEGTTLLSFKLSIGKVGIAGKPLYTNEAIAGLIPKDKSKISDLFLFYLFCSKLIDLENQKDNNAMGKSLNKYFLEKNLKIPVPTLNVQQQIVNECQIIDKEAGEAQKKKDDEECNIEKKLDKIKSFTKDIYKLETITIIQSGGTPSTKNKNYWINGNIPWLRSEVCKNDYVVQPTKFITELGLKNSNAKRLDKNTTLIALVGATKGKTGFLLFEASINQNIASIKSKNKNIILDKYIFYMLRSMYYEIIKDKSAYHMLNLKIIKDIRIPVPPIEIQKEVVSEIERCETVIRVAQEIINDSAKKKEEIIKKYL